MDEPRVPADPPRPLARRKAWGARSLRNLLRNNDLNQSRSLRKLILVVLSLVGIGAVLNVFLSPWLEFREKIASIRRREAGWSETLASLAKDYPGTSQVYELLIDTAGDDPNSPQYVDYLLQYADQAALDHVLARCRSGSASQRLGAMAILGRLCGNAGTEMHPLVAARQEEILSLALDLRSDPNPRIRSVCILVIKEFPSARDKLRLLANDPDDHVRSFCAQVFGRLGDSASVAMLEGMLTDPAPGVRMQALVALSPFRPVICRPILVEIARENDFATRTRVVHALLAINHSELSGFWRELLGAASAELRYLAVRGLTPIEGEEESDALIACLGDPEFTVVSEACTALVWRDDRRALPALIEKLAKARRIGMRDALFQAIVGLSSVKLPPDLLDEAGSLPQFPTPRQATLLETWLTRCLEAHDD